MAQRDNCPPWCSEHVAGPVGVLHRLVMGDVRLTRFDDVGIRRTVCAVRRRAARTPEEMALLSRNLIAAGDLLRYEDCRLRDPGRDERPGATFAPFASA